MNAIISTRVRNSFVYLTMLQDFSGPVEKSDFSRHQNIISVSRINK